MLLRYENPTLHASAWTSRNGSTLKQCRRDKSPAIAPGNAEAVLCRGVFGLGSGHSGGAAAARHHVPMHAVRPTQGADGSGLRGAAFVSLCSFCVSFRLLSDSE